MTFSRISTGAVHAGTAVKFEAHVKSDKATAQNVRLSLAASSATLSAACTQSAGLCVLGDIKEGASQDIDFTVTVGKMTSGTVRIKGEAFATGDVDSGVKTYPLTVTAAPKPKPSPTHSSSSGSGSSGSGSSGGSGSGGSSGSGSSGGSSGSGTSGGTSGAGTSGASGTSGAGGADLPPLVAGRGRAPSIAPSSNPVLPAIPQQTQTRAPATAPVLDTGNSQRMRGTNAADELTFDKLARTQAAWLAALLVAFALLLTQVRLGRVGTRNAKQKGAHRRSRRPGSAH